MAPASRPHHEAAAPAPQPPRRSRHSWSTARALAGSAAWLVFACVVLAGAALVAAAADPRSAGGALWLGAGAPQVASHARRLASCDLTDNQRLESGQGYFYACPSVTGNPYYTEVETTLTGVFGLAMLTLEVTDGADCVRNTDPRRVYPDYSRSTLTDGARFNVSAVFQNSPGCWYVKCDGLSATCSYKITVKEKTPAGNVIALFLEFLARPYGIPVVAAAGAVILLPLVAVWCCKSCGKCMDCCECCNSYCSVCIWGTKMVRKLFKYTFYCGLCCCFCCKDKFGMNCCDMSDSCQLPSCGCCGDGGGRKQRDTGRDDSGGRHDDSEAGDWRQCDACNAEVKRGQHLWSCDPCDYDLCTACYSGIPEAARLRMHEHPLSYRQVAEHGLVAATPPAGHMMSNPMRAPDALPVALQQQQQQPAYGYGQPAVAGYPQAVNPYAPQPAAPGGYPPAPGALYQPAVGYPQAPGTYPQQPHGYPQAPGPYV